MKKKITSFVTVAILSASISTNALASSYTVQKGDSLASIAKKKQTTVHSIKKLNNLKSDALFVNQTLIIDLSPPAKTTNTVAANTQLGHTYTVVKGDSLIKIANKHGITLGELKIWNTLENDTIYIDQKLVVAKAAATPKKEAAKEASTPQASKKDPVKDSVLTKPTTVAPSDKTGSAQEKQADQATAVPSANGEYIVINGDNLSKIAANYRLTVEQLMSLNRLDSDLIFVGQKLIVSGEVKPSMEEKHPAENNLVFDTANVLLNEAMKLAGTPYVFGGSNAEGFDCSGFIHHVYSKTGTEITRQSSQGYYDRSYYIDSPQPGDLVFFENTYIQGISHMGIYIGDDQFIHASDPNGVEIAKLSDAYYQKHFAAFKRFY